jgi:hypothetical protein
MGLKSDSRVTAQTVRAVEDPAPFIDLGGLRSGGPRFEIRLDLGGGITLSIVRH